MNYDIAVVMATYKRPELLQRCLERLIRQTVAPGRFQVLVISDGPDTVSAQLVQKSKQENPMLNIIYSCTPVRQGPAAARNLGWKLADAPLIAFTDDDCLPEPSWLQAFIESEAVHPQNTAFTGRVIVPTPAVPTDYEKNIAGLETADFITANCCCPKLLLEQAGGFDINFTMAWREDSDLHFKLLKLGVRIHKTPTAVVIHPVREAPWGISLKEQRKSMFNALLYRKYPDYYRKLIAPAPVWRYYVILVSFAGGLIAAALGSYVVAVVLLLKWLIWVLRFAWMRLQGTDKSFSHVTEMIATSFIIPFTSVYWTIYGSIKYKVLFL